jgi:hypothetical protein
MWVVGKVAAALGLTPIGAWNVVGFVLSALLLLAFGAWGAWVAGRAWGWLGASLPALVGLLGPAWSVTFAGHSHAVIWPAFAILYPGGAESPSLLLAFVALLLVGWAGRDRPRAVPAAAIGGIAAGLALDVHTYVAMFALTACTATLALSGLDRLRPSTRWRAIGVIVAVTGIVVALVPADQRVARLAVVVGAGLLTAGALGARTGRWRIAAAFATGAAIGAGPQLARIAVATVRGDEFLRLRQQTSAHLGLPPLPVLFLCAPVAALALCSLVWPVARGGAPARIGRDVTRGVLAAGVLLTFNNLWGLDQEPYRFLPYATLLLAVAALPWLVAGGEPGAARRARMLCAALLLATVPSTVRFAREVSGQTVAVGRPERDLYARIASYAPARSLVLVDACIPGSIFKLATGAAIAGYNAGIAFPAHLDPIRSILADQQVGRIPAAADLRQAGVGLIVKEAGCDRSGSAAAYTAAFGPPVATERSAATMLAFPEANRLSSDRRPQSFLLFRVP